MDTKLKLKLDNANAFGRSIARGIVKLRDNHDRLTAAEFMKAVIQLDDDIWDKLEELGDKET
jgi:hypothetical protein